MKNLLSILFLSVVVSAAVLGTAISSEEATLQNEDKLSGPDFALPSDHSEISPPEIQLTNSGQVLEVIDSGIYTYLQVSTEKGPLWLASYKTDVAKGATIKYPTGILMANYYSKSLKRTFKVIVFVDGVKLVK